MTDCQEFEFIRYVAPEASVPAEMGDAWRMFYPMATARNILWYVGDARDQTVETEMEIFFNQRLMRWKKETEFTSSNLEIVLHPAYQDILGMGKDALPFIFKELAANGGPWFWALRHITKEDPVDPEDRGKNKKMRETWLAWGHRHNYI
jgi:hypothetical protein